MYSTTTSTGMALGPGPQRGTPDSPGGEPRTPAQMLNGWLSRLERTPFGGAGNVESVLTAISQGDGLLGMRPAVDAAFNTLIQYEEYGVFVEVFNAWCACCPADDERFDPSLNLRLPHDWVPLHLSAMVMAFSQIKVPTVRMFADEERVDSLTRFHPVPNAVCLCVEALLRAGTRALAVFGELASPTLVAKAFRFSSLQSIILGQAARQHEELGSSERGSYAILAQGLVSCRTLEHLEIRHGDLLVLHPMVTAFSRVPDGPGLTSLTLRTASSVNARSDVKNLNDFVHAAAQCRSLTVLSVQDFVNHIDTLRENILTHFLDHPALTTLEVTGVEVVARADKASIKAMLTVLQFAESCPCLLHVSWKAGLVDLAGLEAIGKNGLTEVAELTPILALIKGSAVNQDGASGGLTVPNGPAQVKVFLN